MMAIPIRLILGNNFAQMDLTATSITMNVDRKVTQYPTPNLAAGRVGIDVNTPEIKIDIAGILADDEHVSDDPMGTATRTNHGKPLYTVINFANIASKVGGDIERITNGAYKTRTFTQSEATMCTTEGDAKYEDVEYQVYGFGTTVTRGEFISNEFHPENTSTTIVCKKINFYYGSPTQEYEDEWQDGWVRTGNQVNKSGGYGTGTSATIELESSFETNDVNESESRMGVTPTQVFKAGDRIVTDDGTFVGTVKTASNSLNDDGTVNTAADNNIVLTAVNATALVDETKLYKQMTAFNHRGKALGFISSFDWDNANEEWTITLTAKNAHSIEKDSPVFINHVGSMSDRLHGQVFKVTPTYFLEDITRSYAGSNIQSPDFMTRGSGVQGVYFRFTDDKTYSGQQGITDGDPSNYLTSASLPSQSRTGRRITSVRGSPGDSDYDTGECIINIPIDAIHTAENPIHELIQCIVDAWDTFKNTNIISGSKKSFKPYRSSAQQDLRDVCDITAGINVVEGCTYSSTSNIVTHSAISNGFELKKGQEVFGKGIRDGTTISSITDTTHFVLSKKPFDSNGSSSREKRLSIGGLQHYIVIEHDYIPKKAIALPNPLSKGLESIGVEYLQTSNFTGSGGIYSAGDKVQNLIGIVSNSHKDVDLIRGIQIPYDSLISSPNVTGTTRNFFLTFGQVDADSKISSGNERSSSMPMDVGGLSNAGGQIPDEEKTWLDKIVESFPGVSGTILNWLKETAETIWVTLDSPPHSNVNGIRVIPNKLHVRYDAGNKYYAFNLELIASDFVIGA